MKWWILQSINFFVSVGACVVLVLVARKQWNIRKRKESQEYFVFGYEPNRADADISWSDILECKERF